MKHALIHRRTVLGGIGAAVAYAVLGVAAGARAENRILAIAYDFVLDPNVDNLRDNLTQPGNTVTWIRGPSFGRLALELGQASYDQIWIWDLDIFNPHVNDADRTALSAWFQQHQRVVLDGRSRGIKVDNDPSEIGLTRNIVAALSSGGGLWIGAGPGPDAFKTGNTYLGALGFNPFTGGFYNNVPLTGTPGHPLLTNPNPIDVQGLRFQTPTADFARSAAPTGLQPNGLTLSTVVRDSLENPLIVTNIPEPPGGFLGGLGAALLLGRRRAP